MPHMRELDAPRCPGLAPTFAEALMFGDMFEMCPNCFRRRMIAGRCLACGAVKNY